MKSYWNIWSGLALAALCGVCGCASTMVAQAGYGAPSGPPALDVSGEWNTNWGPVWLTQNGSHVSGEYYANRSGKIQGTLSGYAMSFNWSEGFLMSGNGQFTFAPGNMSFQGSFWGSSAWNGTRVGPVPAAATPAPAVEAPPSPAARKAAAGGDGQPWWKRDDAKGKSEAAPDPASAPKPEKPKVPQPKSSWDSQL